MSEDAKKIAFISCVNDEEMYAECVRYLRHLALSQGVSAELVPVRGAPSMAAGYEAARRASSARYKVYLHQDILLTEKRIIFQMLESFRAKPGAGRKHLDDAWETARQVFLAEYGKELQQG